MNVREHIVDKLIAAGGFWSYDEKSVRENMSDEQRIEAVLGVGYTLTTWKSLKNGQA